LYTELLI